MGVGERQETHRRRYHMMCFVPFFCRFCFGPLAPGLLKFKWVLNKMIWGLSVGRVVEC